MIPLLAGLAVIAAYLTFVAVRVGLHQRTVLVLGPISLDTIPDRAARMYGNKPLFTCDTPVRWDVPALTGQYRNTTEWSAYRIASTTAYLSRQVSRKLWVYTCRSRCDLQGESFRHPLASSECRQSGWDCVHYQWQVQCGSPRPVSQEPRFEDRHIGCRYTASRAKCRRDVRRCSHCCSCRREERDVAQAESQRLLAAKSLNLEVIWIEDALKTIAHGSGIRVPRGKDEPLYLVHSSGTTGPPKAVILKNRAQSHAVRGWLCYVHVSRNRDKGYMAVPNNHQAVILTFHGLLLLGVPVHWTCAYDREGFDAEMVLRQLAAGGFTGFFGFPITYTANLYERTSGLTI